MGGEDLDDGGALMVARDFGGVSGGGITGGEGEAKDCE